MTIREAKYRGKKLHCAIHRLRMQFEKKKFQLEKALRDLQKVCPHGVVRDENRIQFCEACGKEFGL